MPAIYLSATKHVRAFPLVPQTNEGNVYGCEYTQASTQALGGGPLETRSALYADIFVYSYAIFL